MYRQLREKLRTRVPQVPPRNSNLPKDSEHSVSLPHQRHIKLLSFNIQVGISTETYRHYVTRSWQHILPSSSRAKNLDVIAGLLKQYDIVALQECDGGSMRSGYVNQVEYLAEKSGHPFWYQQLNRNLGKLGQHSNGLLSRIQPYHVSQHKLPGLLPGRGAIVAHFGYREDPLVLVMLHLALGFKAQYKQLEHICELIAPYEHVVVMGDMNNHAEHLLTKTPLRNSNLCSLPTAIPTFPSWRPERMLDHILVSPALQVRNAGVVCFPVSDHLPIAVEIAMPAGYHQKYAL